MGKGVLCLVMACAVCLVFGACHTASQTAVVLPDVVESPGGLEDGMVLVPGGWFKHGSTDGYDDEKPAKKVYVDEFSIDIYEVTADQYKACVDAGDCSVPKEVYDYDAFNGEWPNYGASGRGRHPINSVDWHQAVAFCSARDARLPTEAEWEKAARGTDGRKYPWGNAEPENSRRKLGNFADEAAARTFQNWSTVEGYDDGYDGTAPVGSFAEGVSPYGVHDMAGNVYEWTADWYEKGYYANAPGRNPKGPESGSKRILRGGSWGENASAMRTAFRLRSKSDDWSNDLGFRCAR